MKRGVTPGPAGLCPFKSVLQKPVGVNFNWTQYSFMWSVYLKPSFKHFSFSRVVFHSWQSCCLGLYLTSSWHQLSSPVIIVCGLCRPITNLVDSRLDKLFGRMLFPIVQHRSKIMQLVAIDDAWITFVTDLRSLHSSFLLLLPNLSFRCKLFSALWHL